MTNPRLALLAAIHDLPDDELPRLAYADWLEETGQADHAEFVRGQLWLHAHGKDAPGYRARWERELELIRTHKDAWFGTFRHEWSFYEVRRGFLDEISSHADHVLLHLDWLREHHAVQRLVAGDSSDKELPALLASPLVATLRQLRWMRTQSRIAYFHETLPPLEGASLPLAERPLDVGLAGLGSEDLAEALAASPHLGRMARLDLSLNRLGPGGMQRLLEAIRGWPRLEWLALRAPPMARQRRRAATESNIGPAGVALLATHPAAARLRVLDLADEALSAGAVRALIESPHLDDLRELRLTRPAEGSQARALERRFGARLAWSG